MRHAFGGSPADYAMERVGSQLLVRPAAVGTVWDALTGGTQLTDLTDLTGNPIDKVTADADGAVAFMGPDGVTSLYIDFGYAKRYAMAATDTGAALATFMAQGGEPGGWAQLDGSGHIDPSQIPAQLDWLNVTTYGAKGDGAHDDTINIQTAINACQPGGIVYLPRGVYKTTATLDLKNGVTLLGSHSNMMIGPGMTGADYPCYIQPVMPFTGTSVLQIIGDADGSHPAISGEQRLVNLMLDGSQLTGSSIDGVFAKGNVQNVVMENFTVRQMPNNGIVTASRTDGTLPYSWRLRHVMVDQCHANGILFTGNTDVTLDDVQVIGCWAQGIVLTNCTNAQLLGCRTEWNGSHGYHFTGAWGNWAGSGGMQMTGCSTDRNGQNGVLVDASGNTPISISNLMTRRDGRNGGTGGGNYAGLAVIGATVPVTVDGVTCYPGVDDGGASTNSPQYGVRLSASSTVVLDNAYLHGATAGLLDDGTNTLVSLGTIVTAAGATTSTVRTLTGGGGAGKGLAGARYVVASNASAAEKARADYLCDGTADNVEIQAAIAAAQADGGGIVQLSAGTFNLAATVTINGTLDENNAKTVTLRGVGQQPTRLSVAANVVGISISNWAQVNISDFTMLISGSGIGIQSVGVNNVANSNNISFWHSSFRNLRINGGFVATSTTWGMELGMPWRSSFDNIEIEGCRNGIKLINNATMQNAGDNVFSRFFVEIVGTGGYALYVDSIDGNMNQNTWIDFEAGANSTGCTGIYLGGTVGTASQRFIGNLNLEQFQTLINVANGNSNVFECNYVTCDTGQAGNKGFVTGANSYNNVFKAFYFNNGSNDSVKVIEDANTTSNAPNIFERIRIENNPNGTVTYSTSTSTVLRDITTFNTGNAMPAGLLQYPLTTVNPTHFRPDDHGFLTWTADPAVISGAAASVSAGAVYLQKVRIANRATIVTNVVAYVSNAGVTLTAAQNFAGIYDASGARLAVTADQASAWTTTGTKTMALTAPVTLAVGTYYVALLANGTTPPQFSSAGGNTGIANVGLSNATARSTVTATGNTTLPATVTMASTTPNAATRWTALS
ncbi:glycosyl hydrolase family 28-related protein [Streptomyces sp. NPDC059916]|uniref:glycosyl hydrolase family 28-related protein n=1 Tax=Streptomyces sp. NPDC059916 TaxID=3347001 RepID=UPI00368B16E9